MRAGATIDVEVRNRQRGRRIDVPRLRSMAEALLGEELGLSRASLGIVLVGAGAMAAMNWRWLRHEGSTDILTFDHQGPTVPGEDGPAWDVHGELFISIPDAVVQARAFGTTPSLELARYVVHGVLHLRGFDDLQPGPRRTMKREENRLVRRLAGRHSLRGLVGGAR